MSDHATELEKVKKDRTAFAERGLFGSDDDASWVKEREQLRLQNEALEREQQVKKQQYEQSVRLQESLLAALTKQQENPNETGAIDELTKKNE